ncbi:hypothetical protein GOP47_0012888 [Adiantum capillus-veneris]|uniref:Pentatricopeptide repeat-containing protein n=1 Tax=Adiantum capillus-veneris TaxID=13818 RepID=A0A9D4US22_ADICA|nr:hypothetical protein GOP47_0012888 [Adiantum capillus-veneris]
MSNCVNSAIAVTNDSLARIARESLCTHDWCKPILEELKRRELPSLVRSSNGDRCVWKKSTPAMSKAHSEEKEKQECTEDTTSLFRFQHQQTYKPAAIVAALKSAAKVRDFHRGSQIHADLMGTGLLENNVFVGSSLVNMYAKCGALAKAQDVLDGLQVRNVVSWNALIAGYAQHAYAKEAFLCFERMKADGFSPNAVTFLCIVKACTSMEAIDKGQELHAEIAAEGLLEKHITLSNALIDMYAKFGMLEKAQEVFDTLPMRDVVSWNALILGYAQHGHGEEALRCFEQMRHTGYAPNAITFLSTLKACGSMGNLEKGEEIHTRITKEASVHDEVAIGTALVDMYAKCGSLVKAQELFDKLPERNLISWTALITGYAQNGDGQEAIDCFKNMQLGGYYPNAVTFKCVLKACGSIGASEEGLKLHLQIAKEGLMESDLALGTALMDMYASCGMLPEAQSVFDQFNNQDIVSWNALMTGYSQQAAHSDLVFRCFEQMQSKGFAPNAVTFVCILKASASSGAAYKGQHIHAEIAKCQLLEDAFLLTALVDMYANCGMLVEAQDVFDKAAVWDVAMWNVLIAGYAQLGKDDVVFEQLSKMLKMGIEPDEVTFTILLNSCSHTGLLDVAHFYFETMRRVYGIVPIKEHHTCMVDVFGRAGLLNEAVAVVKNMPFLADRMMWQILLTATHNSKGYIKLGRLAFEHAVQMDENDGAAYVCIGNLYAASKLEGVFDSKLSRGEMQAGTRDVQ